MGDFNKSGDLKPETGGRGTENRKMFRVGFSRIQPDSVGFWWDGRGFVSAKPMSGADMNRAKPNLGLADRDFAPQRHGAEIGGRRSEIGGQECKHDGTNGRVGRAGMGEGETTGERRQDHGPRDDGTRRPRVP